MRTLKNARGALFAGTLIASFPMAGACAAQDEGPLVLAAQGAFYIPGEYVYMEDGTQTMAGQMFVQFQIPEEVTKPYPIILYHGGSQTAMNFISTPDGREGWGEYFVRQGYPVYMIDGPGRARSGYGAAYGETRKPDVNVYMSRFTAFKDTGAYPQAQYHTQWPGTGQPGDQTFDEFYASQVEDVEDITVQEDMSRTAMAKLLERIGPSVVIAHSQGTSMNFGLLDDHPELVKGFVAIEPNGPPFYYVKNIGAPEWFDDGNSREDRPWGITRTALTFEPPIQDPAALAPVQEEVANGDGLVRCWLPSVSFSLPNLQGIPILVLTGEASYHAPYDHCTSKFLTNGGVEHDFVRLPDHGITGNGHMMMLEKNNLSIASLMNDWLVEHVY